MENETILLTRTYDYLDWILPRSHDFKKIYRNNMTQRLVDASLDFQESIYLAQAFDDQVRLRHLRTADAHLNMIRCYLRLFVKCHELSKGQYEHVSRMIAEMGRLLGGWIRQTKK
jgi:hypothetical protein